MTFVTINTKKARLVAFSDSKEKDLNICTFMGFPARTEITMQNQPTKNMMILVTTNTGKARIATNMVSMESVLNFLTIYGSPKRRAKSATRMRQRINRAAATRVTIRETEETEASITGPPSCYVRLKYGYRKYIRMVVYAAMDRNIAVEIREQLMFSSLKK